MRSTKGLAACMAAAAVLPSFGFVVPALSPAVLHRSGRTGVGSRLPIGAHVAGSLSRTALDGRPQILTEAGRRTRRRRATCPLMVFGGGGGGRGGGGGFRVDPGTVATICVGLLFVFAPGFVFGAFNTLFLVVTVGPILFSVGLNLYNKFNIVDAPCPVCGVGLQGLKNRQNQCPSCGAMLVAQNGKFESIGSGYVRDEAGAQQEFSRMGDSGVIDVDAIDVDD